MREVHRVSKGVVRPPHRKPEARNARPTEAPRGSPELPSRTPGVPAGGNIVDIPGN